MPLKPIKVAIEIGFVLACVVLAALLVFMLASGCTPQPPVTPPVVVEPGEPTVEPIRAKLLQIHNDNRTSPLTINSELTLAAQGHADWMAANRRMSHRGERGSNPGGRIKAAGYSWSTYGENVAYGQSTPEDVMRVWLNSLGHRRNIKSGAYADVGFGFATSSAGRIYWCVTFGSRGFGSADEWDESWAMPEFRETCDGCGGVGRIGLTDDNLDTVCPYCRGSGVLIVEEAFEKENN